MARYDIAIVKPDNSWLQPCQLNHTWYVIVSECCEMQINIFFCHILNDKCSTKYNCRYLFKSTAMHVALREISICMYAYLNKMFAASKTLLLFK